MVDCTWMRSGRAAGGGGLRRVLGTGEDELVVVVPASSRSFFMKNFERRHSPGGVRADGIVACIVHHREDDAAAAADHWNLRAAGRVLADCLAEDCMAVADAMMRAGRAAGWGETTEGCCGREERRGGKEGATLW